MKAGYLAREEDEAEYHTKGRGLVSVAAEPEQEPSRTGY